MSCPMKNYRMCQRYVKSNINNEWELIKNGIMYDEVKVIWDRIFILISKLLFRNNPTIYELFANIYVVFDTCDSLNVTINEVYVYIYIHV